LEEEQLKGAETEAQARVFVAENEPLLERATPATLHRIILHGSDIATQLSDEVVEEMNAKTSTLNTLAAAINDADTPPARIQELEEERLRVEAEHSTRQETLEGLSDLLERAITLREERDIVGAPFPTDDPDLVEGEAPDASRGF
jgi:hypothetical protein